MRTPVQYKVQTRYEPVRGPALDGLTWWEGIQQFEALMGQLPPGTILAASEYGYIGSQRPGTTILDLLGLQDRLIAQNGFSPAELFKRDPDLIWLPHPDYSRILQQILDSKEFRTEYEYYPGMYTYGIAIRRESPRFVFARLHPGRILSDYRTSPIE